MSNTAANPMPPSKQTSAATTEEAAINSFLDAMKKRDGNSDEELRKAFGALASAKGPNSDTAAVSAEVLRRAIEHRVELTVEEVEETIRYIKEKKVKEQIQIDFDQFKQIVKLLEEPTVADQVDKIYKILSRGERKKIVLYGKAGVGKTWLAGKIAGRAQGEFDFAVWVYLNRTYEGMSLYESIAYQLSVPFEESEEYKKESEKLKKKQEKEEKEEKEKEKEKENEKDHNKDNAIQVTRMDSEKDKREFEKKVREAVKRKFENKIRDAIQGKKLLLILDEASKKRLEWIESPDEHGKKRLHFKLGERNVGEILGLDPAKSFFLITSKNQPRTDSDCIGIKVRPWTWEESKSLVIQGIDKSDEKKDLDEKVEFFIRKSERLPPEILIIGRAVSYFAKSALGLEKLQKDKEVLEKEGGSKVCDILIRGYERLPKSVLIDCYNSETPERHFLHRGGMVNFNELICYWIMEGHLGHFERIEDAYEEGHRVLMELIYCGLLEKQEGNCVAPTGPRFNFDIHDRDEFYRKVHSGLGVTYDMKLGAVALDDGMIRTVGSNGKNKMSTFIIDGNHIDEKLAASSLFEPKSDPGKGNATELEKENIVIFNPTCHHFQLPIQKMVNLRLLALRGCRFLDSIESNFHWEKDQETDLPNKLLRSRSAGHTPGTTPQNQKIQKMDKLTVLEISGPSPLNDIPNNLFNHMLNLKTVNMSCLMIKTLPSSFYQLTKIEFLILRGCLELTELQSLQNLKGLQVLDVSGSISFTKFHDKNLHQNSKLQILNLSRTNIKTIPLINFNPDLKFISVSDCPVLQRIRKMDKLEELEIFDMSGAKEVEEFCNPSLETLKRLVIFDVSRTAIKRLPSNVSNPRFFHVQNCSNLKRLPPIEEFTKVEAIDLSDSCFLGEKRQEFFSKMECLRELNLSRTKIKHLPCLRSLRRLRLSQCEQFEELENWSSLEELEYLDLSGCKALKEMGDDSFEKMNRLTYLNLSGTPLPRLPSLSKLMKLKELYVRDCPNLTTLPGIEELPLLETLDHSGTILSPPPSFSNPARPKVLGASLDNIDNPQLLEVLGASSAAGEFKPSDLKEDFRICMWKISNWQATIDKNTLDSPVSVYGIHFLHLLNNYPSLMKNLSQFHFLVYPTEAEAKLPIKSYRIESSLRDIYFEQLPLEKLERRLEIRALDTCPPFIGRVLEHSQLVALVEDPFFKSLLDLCGDANITAMKACWIEKCDELEHVIAEEKENPADVFKNLETLWISDSLKVKSILKGDIQSITFKSIKHLYLEYCPELTMICSKSLQLESLEILYVKYCRRITTLFTTDDSPHLKKLTKLHLWGLPVLKTTGCNAPFLRTLTVGECPSLEHVIEAAKEADEEQREVEANRRKEVEGHDYLETLHVKHCDRLKSICEEDQPYFPKLRELEMWALPEVQEVAFHAPSLQCLRVGECRSLQHIKGKPDALKSLEMEHCETVETVFGNGGLGEVKQMIWGCPKLSL